MAHLPTKQQSAIRKQKSDQQAKAYLMKAHAKFQGYFIYPWAFHESYDIELGRFDCLRVGTPSLPKEPSKSLQLALPNWNRCDFVSP